MLPLQIRNELNLLQCIHLTESFQSKIKYSKNKKEIKKMILTYTISDSDFGQENWSISMTEKKKENGKKDEAV